jgi:hypothetical protein
VVYLRQDWLGETERVHPAIVVQAAAMFVATNIDDLVVLAVFSVGRGVIGRRPPEW